MKTLDDIRCELREAASAREIDLGFDPMDSRVSLDRLMRTCDLLLGPPGKSPCPRPTPAPPPAAGQPAAPKAEATGYNRILAAYDAQLKAR